MSWHAAVASRTTTTDHTNSASASFGGGRIMARRSWIDALGAWR
jgi:hypothetical protein